MSWILLVMAGLLEAGWVLGLKYTQGFTKPIPSVLTIAGIIASMYLLALATRTLPIGTAYDVWVSNRYNQNKIGCDNCRYGCES